MFKMIKLSIVSFMGDVDEFLNKFRFTLKLYFIRVESGWFMGEELKLLHIKLIESIDSDAILIFEIQILKFAFNISIEF